MFTLHDLLEGNGSNVRLVSNCPPDPALTFRSAHHDSRQIEPGDLFVAIRGEKVDGHSFIPAVARAGALGALCLEPSTDVPADFLQIVVPNVVAALQATARVRAARRENTTFIAITGSNGKTSTKEATAAVLSRLAPTLKTQASYNNEIGYPLTLLRLEPQHRYAVLEMGAQWVGELAGLSSHIAAPDWAIITNVGTAHIEYFGSQQNIIIAKSELVQALQPTGFAILNYDDVNVRNMQAKTQARVLFYGQSPEADVRASDIAGDELFGFNFSLHYRDQRQQVQLRLPGAHGVTIALAAAATGCAAGMPLAEIGAALEALSPAKGRCEIKAGPNGSILIDDTYNANRQSIIAITRAMRHSRRNANGKRWAILGDIFETGSYARDEHYSTGTELARNVDYLVAIGDAARWYIEGAIAAGLPAEQMYYFRADVENAAELNAAKEEAAELVKRALQSGDLLLVKGSRGMRMESIFTLF